MISRSGPSRRVNACASSAATFNRGIDPSVLTTALTVAARGSRRSNESSANGKNSKHEHAGGQLLALYAPPK